MLFKGNDEFSGMRQGMDQGGFPNTARANNGNELIHKVLIA